MPTQTGIWNQQEADTGHIFSYKLAKWIAGYFPKDEPVFDLGCGKGTYLSYLNDVGFSDLTGVEGTALSDFEHSNIKVKDLARPVNLGKQGNVICLEVAEHIPAQFEADVIDNMVRHIGEGQRLVMSWAIPGQDGHGHVNCRDNIWVVDQFYRRGLRLQLEETMQARAITENHCSWFKNTILVFRRP